MHPELTDALLEARAAGDDAALDRAAWALVQEHMGWIVTLHRRYTRQSSWPAAARDDYLQELVLDAHRAMRTWDPDRATPATWIAQTARAASARVTSQVTGLPRNRVDAMDAARKRGEDTGTRLPAALDAPVSDDGATLGDMLAVDDPDVAGEVTEAAALAAFWAESTRLPALERIALLERLGGTQFSEIGERLGMTKEAARLAERRARDRLAHPTTLRRIVRGVSGS